MWFEKVKRYYETGLWTAAMVQNAVDKDKITQEQAETILRDRPSQ